MPITTQQDAKTTRMHTRVLVRVDSHTRGTSVLDSQTIDLSADTISLSTSKNTKALGKFQIQLVPRRNYLNLIFPDDVVNIYVDPGDGQRGFVRVLMGYVDRVERQESVDDNGAMQTRYVVIGSDFQKAIDKTFIYFNEYMRTQLDERFLRTTSGPGRPNQGNFSGTALRQAGLTMAGTPADFVENFLRILLGFQQQWVLPETYTRTQSNIQNVRVRAVQRAKARLPTTVVQQIAQLGFNPTDLDKTINDLIDQINQQVSATGESGDLLAIDDKRSAALSLRGNADLLAFQTLVQSVSDPSLPIGIHDLLSLDFIEALAIDGFNFNEATPQANNQTLSQFLYGHSNELVNELIFDLRPVGQKDGLNHGPYSTAPDEIGMNVYGTTDFPATVAAVQYVPAVVFREYPYSVIESLDLSSLVVTASGSTPNADSPPVNAGVIMFGPVFAVSPNVPGRHIYTYPESIAPQPSQYNANATPVKHIDCVVIHNTDVQASALGRSDDDIINAFHLYASSPIPADAYRDLLSNFNPIVNQISISRHGFRLKEQSTEFANYGDFPQGGQKGNHFPRKNLIRWTMLMDHWFVHNPEYLTGTITVRGMPEIRVGYRLDWYERNESYYVESVHHQWTYPGPLITTIEVSRGQRNDPFPAYIPPTFLNNQDNTLSVAAGNRTRDGRLAQYFVVKDTRATVGAIDRHQDDIIQLGYNSVDQPFYLRRRGNYVPAFVDQENT